MMNFRQRMGWVGVALYLLFSIMAVYYVFEVHTLSLERVQRGGVGPSAPPPRRHLVSPAVAPCVDVGVGLPAAIPAALPLPVFVHESRPPSRRLLRTSCLHHPAVQPPPRLPDINQSQGRVGD
ncbi:transmembrane protein 251 [Lates japonicus]